MSDILPLVIALWFGAIFWAAFEGGRRDCGTVGGLLLGFILGPVGLALVFLSPSKKPDDDAGHIQSFGFCPYCDKQVRSDAKACKHCGRRFARSE